MAHQHHVVTPRDISTPALKIPLEKCLEDGASSFAIRLTSFVNFSAATRFQVININKFRLSNKLVLNNDNILFIVNYSMYLV